MVQGPDRHPIRKMYVICDMQKTAYTRYARCRSQVWYPLFMCVEIAMVRIHVGGTLIAALVMHFASVPVVECHGS